MDIEERFKEAKTITEVFNVMRELRNDGYELTEVNAAANKRKKELLAGDGARPNKIKKIVVPSDNEKGGKYTCFGIAFNHFNDNSFSTVGNNIDI